MNYARIYAEFIADRRGKESQLDGYTERHHIVPRSLGGSDDASNLIDLTADDHLMAYMLLAKIYGRTMWHALRCMMGSQRNKDRVFTTRKIRLAYKLASENYGKAVSAQFESQKFRKKHADATAAGTREAFNRPEVRRKHLAALQKMKRPCKHDAHIKAYKHFMYKMSCPQKASARMKSFYAEGRLIGTRSYNPSQDPKLKPKMLEAARRRYENESDELKQSRIDAMHTKAAMAKRLETLKSSEAWAAFQERNRGPRPNMSGENHWRAKKRAAELA